ncbi:MAG: hypothetical protein ACTSU5_14555 [Promethearchaeota archaeon]
MSLEISNFEELVQTMQNDLEIPVAIANQWGIVLGTTISNFEKGGVIPPSIWRAIESRKLMEEELEIEKVKSFILETSMFHWVFTFGEKFIFITSVQQKVDFSQYLPIIENLVSKLDQQAKIQEQVLQEFSEYDFSRELNNLMAQIKEVAEKKRYKIMKHLIKYMRS